MAKVKPCRVCGHSKTAHTATNGVRHRCKYRYAARDGHNLHVGPDTDERGHYVTITDGPDLDAPIPDPSLTVTRGLAEKAPKLYDDLFARFIELTDSTPGNWARMSAGSWQNQITGTIFTVSLG